MHNVKIERKPLSFIVNHFNCLMIGLRVVAMLTCLHSNEVLIFLLALEKRCVFDKRDPE